MVESNNELEFQRRRTMAAEALEPLIHQLQKEKSALAQIYYTETAAN